jgi:hypothetical protein
MTVFRPNSGIHQVTGALRWEDEEGAVVDTFVRAIATSDFERRLQQVEADHANPADASAGTNGAGPNWVTTHRREFAADSPQIAGNVTIDSIHGCGAPPEVS